MITHYLLLPSKGVSFSHCSVQLCVKISRGNIVYAPLPDLHQSIFGFRTSFSYFGFTKQCSRFFLFRILLICPDKIYLFQKHGFIPSPAKFRLLLGELGSNLIIQLDRTSGNLSGKKISPRMNALINRLLHFIKDASYASTNFRNTLNLGAG